ncbi:flavodoxin family protein [Sphingomicrobium astaxanthinifaciens]|uniref:flavodoxin family protein n=1 Tax=Sphingomicrobium astaxanthinifaciens TaxID=1227949 RepID=UPI001FCB3F6C|nr:NAD(P)H-dependent oxidoreductase [Sphingomicrobium astaxanthinifaciens]MCJ7422139.1 NAD(P)H-dependent oxidoreductase [Sphingomicrobium astaxanthinifaciens]
MSKLTPRQRAVCDAADLRAPGLAAVLVNATLKPPGEASHTDTLLDVVDEIFTRAEVAVDRLRLSQYRLAPGVYPDMTEHGWDRDDWPEISARVIDADILVLGTPIWLGEKSSLAQAFIEKLYAHSGQTNDKGQYRFYGKVGGCLVTGNEDGIKHVAAGVLYAMGHVGYTIPPQADCGWIGAAGPGPSYGDELADGSRAGFDNVFTQRNTTFMAFNLLHMARLLKEAGGLPAVGNVRSQWDDGSKPGWPNPEHRLDD